MEKKSNLIILSETLNLSLSENKIIDKYLNVITEAEEGEETENLFDQISDDFNEEENEDEENEGNESDNDINKIKRKLVWLAHEFDKLNDAITRKIKDHPVFLKVLYKLTKARELFRFFLDNYSLYSEDEIKQIATILESLLEEIGEEAKHCSSEIYIY